MQRVSVRGISKTFRIGFRKHEGALARILSLFSGKLPKKTIYALRNVSFSADSGEILGIIGKNGSGKSTLLRVIAGIYPPCRGRIFAKGRLVSLIGLGAGFQDRLDVRDNIFLAGALFGMSRKGIKKRIAQILGFAQLESFEGTQLYQLSEGMKQRLAFSIAAHCNPDILLLDEVFEVGDESFKKKSAETINNLVSKGAAVLLVSHDLEMVRKHCSRVILMKNGRISAEGSPGNIIKKYSKN